LLLQPRSEALMKVIDQINQGRLGKVYFAARGRDASEWMMKRDQLSPRYTTELTEIPVVGRRHDWKEPDY